MYWLIKQKYASPPERFFIYFVLNLFIIWGAVQISIYAVDSKWMDSDGEKKLGPIHQTMMVLDKPKL